MRLLPAHNQLHPGAYHPHRPHRCFCIYQRYALLSRRLNPTANSRAVGINHGNLKNRLGAYHAPLITFLDFNMLRTLPEGQVRNGFAGTLLLVIFAANFADYRRRVELMKISSCADKRTWDLLVENGEALIKTRFGRADGATSELKAIADEICWRGIKVMLDVRSVYIH